MDSTEARVAWPLRACPRVVAAGRFTQRDREFAKDYRNQTLTLHLFSYSARIRIGGNEYDIRPGDLTITAPGRSLRFAIDRPGVHWCIRLQPARALGPGRLRLPIRRRLTPAAAAEARRRIEMVIADYTRTGSDPEHPLAVAAGLAGQSLLCWLAAEDALAPMVNDPVEKARQLLANQQCARVPISEIAQRCGRSQNRLATAFRDRLGMSMRQYRVRCLIETAMQLMQTTRLPMAEIRQRIELADPHHFNKVFRRITGLGPRAWLAAQAPVVTTSARPETAR